MESAQISGNVFRFLSTMHPSLTKQERKRYAAFDHDKWYEWTPEIAGEFTDLMKRSPRDSTFARGLALAATKGLPEDVKLTATELVAGLSTLPAAYMGPNGSGFDVQMLSPGNAEVFYSGMPGFANVCIAVAGELTKRLQDVGARGLDVRHAEGCRLQGADACRFEVRWTAEPGDHAAAPEPEPQRYAATTEPEPERSYEAPEPPRRSVPSRPVLAEASAAASAESFSTGSGGGSIGNSSDDLFEQLRSRLVEAERQTARHRELEAHIEALDARAAELESALAEAEADARQAREALADLKRRLRELAG